MMQIGNIVDDTNIGFKNPQRGRVYSSEGLSSCLNCCEGGGLEPKILENNAKTICLNSKVDGKQPSLENRIYSIEGVMTACTTSFHPNIAIPQATKQGYIEVEPGGVFDAAYPESTTRRGRVQEGGKVTPTLCTSNELSVYEGVKNQEYRIRKLTPRECFRLMGVAEENIDKIQAAGISNAQQYKMAGNSIVADTLYHIFRKMFVEKESDHAELTLF